MVDYFLETCQDIIFENKSLVFTAGDIISGYLVFKKQPIRVGKIFSIQMQLAGKVMVVKKPWKANIYQEKSPQSFLLELAEKECGPFVAIHSECNVDFRKNGINYSPGIQFTLDIPSNLPSSIFGVHGFICYRIIFLVKSYPNAPPGKYALLREILIIGIMQPRLEIGCKSQFKTCKASAMGGEVVMSAEIEPPRENLTSGGFVPGEDLHFLVKVQNGSKLPLAGLKVAIFAATSYKNLRSLSRKEGQEIRTTKQLVLKEGPHVPPGPGRIVKWNGNVKIPHVVPTGLGLEGCNNIDVQYFLQFELTKFVNLRLIFEIGIGNSKDISGNESAYESDMLGDLSSRSSDFGSTLSLLSLNSCVASSSVSSSSVNLSSTTAPPSYKSEWEFENISVETPPPPYNDQSAGRYSSSSEKKRISGPLQ